MNFSIVICVITIVALIVFIIFKPSIKVKNWQIQTFWIISLIGAFMLILFGNVSFSSLKTIIISNDRMNPIQILILFISMSILSIALDEAGFFKKCAYFATKITKNKQYVLFFSLSVVVSILTIFTSNDIVILTFTPFICYFAKHAKINPIPYLIGEYVFANTWSMLFIIGNPTNVFLATSFEMGFVDYFKVMVLPTIGSGILATIILIFLFKKELKKKIDVDENVKSPYLNKELTIISLVHLIICTVFLIVSSYISIPMWIISFCSALSLTIVLMIYYIIRKDKIVFNVYKRAPWNLIPFVLSMFIIISSLEKSFVIEKLAVLFNRLGNSEVQTIYTYGVTSYFMCNILNNIPMSVMMEKVIASSNSIYLSESVYSSIIASNIGAYLTPIGALAGIMWMSILHNSGIKFSFKQFIKYGLSISFIVLVAALSILIITI